MKEMTEDLSDNKEKQKERETQGMKLIQEIGNGIDESIKIEVDIPSKYEEGKLPIPDVKVWVSEKVNIKEGRRGTTETRKKKKKVMYEHPPFR